MQFELEVAKDPNGKIIENVYLLHLDKQVEEELAKQLITITGIASLAAKDRYTIILTIGKLFSKDEVCQHINEIMSHWLSPIILPPEQGAQVKRNIRDFQKSNKS